MTAQDHYRTPPHNLADRICSRIEHARIVRNRIHIALHGSIAIGTILAFVPAIRYASTQASQSGFYEYASLVISDGSYLISNWKVALVSILESAPLMGTALSIGVLLIFANAVQRGTRYIKINISTIS